MDPLDIADIVFEQKIKEADDQHKKEPKKRYSDLEIEKFDSYRRNVGAESRVTHLHIAVSSSATIVRSFFYCKCSA